MTVNYSPNKREKKKSLSAMESKLNFSADWNPRKEPIPNMSNLRDGFCHKSYALWKNDLNGLSFNP